MTHCTRIVRGRYSRVTLKCVRRTKARVCFCFEHRSFGRKICSPTALVSQTWWIMSFSFIFTHPTRYHLLDKVGQGEFHAQKYLKWMRKWNSSSLTKFLVKVNELHESDSVLIVVWITLRESYKEFTDCGHMTYQPSKWINLISLVISSKLRPAKISTATFLGLVRTVQIVSRKPFKSASQVEVNQIKKSLSTMASLRLTFFFCTLSVILALTSGLKCYNCTDCANSPSNSQECHDKEAKECFTVSFFNSKWITSFSWV